MPRHNHHHSEMKANGAKGGAAVAKHEVESDGESEVMSEEESPTPLPKNVQERVNALKNVYLDSQRIDYETHKQVFKLEADAHRKMESMLRKRYDIISGAQEPSEAEKQFKLKSDEEEQPTTAADDSKGVPKFWLTALLNSSLTNAIIAPHDTPILESLKDIRVQYKDGSELGFTIEFHFDANPYFTNEVLKRSYDFDDKLEKEQLYMANTLLPRRTEGTAVDWKEGKNITRKIQVTTQRNKKTGARREVKKEVKQESFFNFFTPDVADLTTLRSDSADDNSELAEQAETAEFEYEVATALRTRIVPRAVLYFTGEEDDDMGDADYEDESGDEDEDDMAGGDHEDDE